MFDSLYNEKYLKDTKNSLRRFLKGEGKTIYSGYSEIYEYRQVEDNDLMINNACKSILKSHEIPGLNIPRIISDFGTTSTAEFFGNKATKPSGCNKWIEPIIYNIDDIKKIVLQPSNSLDVNKAYKLWDSVSKKLNTKNLTSSFIDIQGPLNTAALIWEQTDFMMAMYDHPKKVHQVLEIITYKLIDIVKEMISSKMNVEAPLWPYIWLPQDIGVGITEDYMPLLSPELYKEFGIPYLKLFAKHFEGIFIHCCGQFNWHIDNLAKSGINIIGMEYVHPNIDVKKLFNAFGSSAVFVPNIMDNSIDQFGSMAKYYKYVNSVRNKETRLWYLINTWQKDIDEQVNYLDSIRDF